MIIKPSTPSATEAIMRANPAALTLDSHPTAVGHDSSALAGWANSPVGSHLLPDKFTLPPTATRSQRLAAWSNFLTNLIGGKGSLLADFTPRGAQSNANPKETYY
jgi:hypothetical protein